MNPHFIVSTCKSQFSTSDRSISAYAGSYNNVAADIEFQSFLSESDANEALSDQKYQQSLMHPSILCVYFCDYYRDSKTLRIAHEPVGLNLVQEVANRRMNKFPWEEQHLWEDFRGLIEALAYGQENNIAHRNIAPGSIFLTLSQRKQLKISCFRCSKPADEYYATIPQQSYLSPELRYPQGYYAVNPFASDVYSLGLVFLYMIRCGEDGDLWGIENLEARTAAVLQTLNVSDTMKGLLVWMLQVQNRCDFLSLRDYFHSLFLQPVPQVLAESQYPQVDYHSAGEAAALPDFSLISYLSNSATCAQGLLMAFGYGLAFCCEIIANIYGETYRTYCFFPSRREIEQSSQETNPQVRPSPVIQQADAIGELMKTEATGGSAIPQDPPMRANRPQQRKGVVVLRYISNKK